MATQVSLTDGAVASAGALAIQTNGTTQAVSISTGQVATLAQNPILTSGTANGVAYLNGSKAVTSGSALKFDGTALAIGSVTPSTWMLDVKSAGTGVVTNGIRFNRSNVTTQYGVLNYEGGQFNNVVVNTAGTGCFWGILYSSDGSTTTQPLALDASGNLALGTTSSLSPSSGRIDLTINGTSSAMTSFGTGNTRRGYFLHDATDLTIASETAGSLRFLNNGSERARINSSGYFKASNNGTYVGSASSFHELVSNDASNGVAVIESTSTSYTSYVLFVGAARNTTNNTFYAIGYYNRGAGAYKFLVADSGNVTNTNGSYGTISDAKMKADIVDAGSQWDDIKGIRFRKFKMKNDPNQIVQLGVVAQELEQTSPGLVEEHIDRDEEGNDLGTTTKSVKTSVLLMKAAVALQEAMARIEQLESTITQLQADVAALKGA